jgi:hypothetical protein
MIALDGLISRVFFLLYVFSSIFVPVFATVILVPTSRTNFDLTEAYSTAVFRIRIHVFFGLPDLDPLVRGMDPDPDLSIIMQK